MFVPFTEVLCWGQSSDGALGYSGSIIDAATPLTHGAIQIGAGLTAKRVEVGQQNTCVVTTDDTVKCWGEACKYPMK